MRGWKRYVTILIAVVLCSTLAETATAQQVTGSGSTFVYPVMKQWAAAYEQASGIHVDYEPVGSTRGVADIETRAVDFGASDVPLLPAELARDGLVQFPVVIGAIVPIVNLDGIAPGQLHLTGPLLADIYLGKITYWNDPAIAAINSDIKLPHLRITVIHRSDGSGTTFNWSDYLSKVSITWKTQVGASTSVAWPIGSGAKGSGQVADYVLRTKGAIGYVEFAYVLQKKLIYGLVRNHAGNFVQPGAASFEAATRSIDWEKTQDFDILLNDASDADAYPIVATSFVLLHKQPQDTERLRRTLDFFHWALTDGREMASALDYVPLPFPLVRQVDTYWQTSVR